MPCSLQVQRSSMHTGDHSLQSSIYVDWHVWIANHAEHSRGLIDTRSEFVGPVGDPGPSWSVEKLESRQLLIRPEGFARKQLDDGIGDTLVSLRNSLRVTDKTFSVLSRPARTGWG